MAAPRLPFLWPILFRPASRPTTAAVESSARLLQRPPPRAYFRQRSRACAPATKRYGTANEPPQQAQAESAPEAVSERTADDEQIPRPSGKDAAPSAEQNAAPIGKDYVSPAEQNVLAQSALVSASISDLKSKPSSPHTASKDSSTTSIVDAQAESGSKQASTVAPTEAELAEEYHTNSALTTILNMKPPMDQESAEDKPPHLQAPPYVHHFDTYSLVKSLHDDGGWSDEQAVEVMKAVRGILTANMELARDGLVSKSDAEMV